MDDYLSSFIDQILGEEPQPKKNLSKSKLNNLNQHEIQIDLQDDFHSGFRKYEFDNGIHAQMEIKAKRKDAHQE